MLYAGLSLTNLEYSLRAINEAELLAMDSDNPSNSRLTDFEKAGVEPTPGLLADFWQFLREEKKWWLMPIIVLLVFAGILAVAGASGAAPFIYALF